MNGIPISYTYNPNTLQMMEDVSAFAGHTVTFDFLISTKPLSVSGVAVDGFQFVPEPGTWPLSLVSAALFAGFILWRKMRLFVSVKGSTSSGRAAASARLTA